ncbi:serine hydrolase domain-containing protein [Sphingomonas sp. Y38-1Y]|uniref:serine hydrolase domain-containing protein n=1 Tax=Sphingomonas sp. Y38-1Y TaxID=3078265 RepID=UPI0028F08DEB|nr:serine hydrolase domain-containing protein [Sphingomonas sp. Y38-1Y]
MTDITIDTAALDALLRPYDRTDAPGFAVGVAHRGRPAYRRGVGLASVELPVALSPTIRMRIGSTSKHFTVLAVMLLAEEGRLSIDDTPRRHLPELPGWADRITIRQLMAHTSGMRDSLDLILHAAGPGVAAEPDYQFRLLAALDDVNFEPGATWSYNNGGYVLLAEIAARVSGTAFADLLRERIFAPIGMNDTLLRALDTDLVPNSATLHVPVPGGGWRRGVFGVPIGGEGGIVSTVDDMLRWLAHMSAPRVGSAETWATMRTPVTTHGYGLALTTDTRRGLTTLHHAGAVVGGSCQMMKVLDHELDIIVMSNGIGGLDLHRLVDDIIDRCIPDLPPVEADHPAEVVTGIYYSRESGRRIALEAVDDKQAIRIDGMTLPARRDADGRLSVPLVPTDMRVTPESGGGALTLAEYGASERLVRVDAPAEPDWAAITGRFVNASAEMSVSVERSEEDATLRLAGPLGAMDYRLRAIGSDLWEARAAGTLSLALLVEVDGKGLRVTTGRTHRLRFARAAG